jgi:two-component system nitrate/nitrite response regulator NarL
MARSRKLKASSAPVLILASPNREVRERWRRGLGDGFPVHEVSRRADLDQAMTLLGPEILLLDVTLSRPGGVAAVAAVQRLRPSTRIILMTRTPNEKEGINALKAGVRGYCDQGIAPSLLKRAVDRVHEGEIWVGRTLVPRLLEELTSLTERRQEASRAGPDSRLEKLTQREFDIANLIGGGASNKEIAATMEISPGTVKAHLTTVFKKLGFSDRLRLALFVVNESLKRAKT